MNFKSYKIKDDFFINEGIVEMPEQEEAKTIKIASHQYIIIDRSGSMWGDLDHVLDTIIKYVDTLAEGSQVSLGWFSGNGEYGLSVPYELKKEKNGVVNTCNEYRRALGCTNFTEILQKIKKDCSGKHSSLFFFTDGCHNCGSFKNVINELEQLKELLDVSVFVGCGYIDRDNMTEMAQVTNGAFIQLTSFNEFENALYDFKEGVEESVPGCLVALPEEAKNICSILGKNVVSYTRNDNGEVYYKATDKKVQKIYSTSAIALGDVVEMKDEVAARALIHNLIQHNRTPKALEILNVLGDKYYMRKLYNTFTADEYSSVENEVLKSIFDSKKRYKEGKVKGFMPDDNAFCVLDALDTIANDDNALIYLNDKEFEYKSTSRKSVQEDGSKLIYPKEIKASANVLKYHENRLNVNLNVFYKAEVALNSNEFTKTNAMNENLEQYGFKEGQKVPVNCIRNFNIILDGKLNTPKLVLSKLSKPSINTLSNNLRLREDGKYVLELANLPLINKGYLTETSAKSLAEKAWKSYDLGIKVSVLKYLKDAKTVTDETEVKTASQFLEENYYIKNGSYQPPKTSVEATDEYQSYEFSISFKGFSKPSTSTVIKKLQAGGNATEREKLVEIYYNQYKNNTLEEIITELEKTSKEHRELQTTIQHAKFAIILINRGYMEEFTSREDMTLDIQANIGDVSKTISTTFKVVTKPVKI